MDKSNIIESNRELKFILTSKAFRILLNERKEYAQKEVNKFVREQKLTEAFGALCKLEDTNKLLDIIQNKVNEIEKELKS